MRVLVTGACGWTATSIVEALNLTVAGYSAFHIIGSAGAREHFDIERTERELGLVCAERFERYGD